jgi:hypothetical protein
MADQIHEEISEGDGYLRVTLTGDFPQQLPDAVDLHARLHVLSRGSGHTRYLVDIRGIGQRLGIPAAFEYANLAFPDEPEAVRTAVLDLSEHLVTGRFFENLMLRRGHSLHMFTDEAEALEWLLSES